VVSERASVADYETLVPSNRTVHSIVVCVKRRVLPFITYLLSGDCTPRSFTKCNCLQLGSRLVRCSRHAVTARLCAARLPASSGNILPPCLIIVYVIVIVIPG